MLESLQFLRTLFHHSILQGPLGWWVEVEEGGRSGQLSWVSRILMDSGHCTHLLARKSPSKVTLLSLLLGVEAEGSDPLAFGGVPLAFGGVPLAFGGVPLAF